MRASYIHNKLVIPCLSRNFAARDAELRLQLQLQPQLQYSYSAVSAQGLVFVMEPVQIE
eukprot:gene5323-10647_t